MLFQPPRPLTAAVFTLLPEHFRQPDGLTIDEAGSLAVAHAGLGVGYLLSRRGLPLYQIEFPGGEESVTNVAFGDADLRSLYITQSQAGLVLKATMPVAGLRPTSHH